MKQNPTRAKFLPGLVPMTIAALACCCLLISVSGCTRDPEVRKEKHLNRGIQYFGEDKFEEAIIEFRNVLQIDPEHHDARYNLGLCYLRKAERGAALDEFEQAVKLAPNFAEAYLQLAPLYRAARRYEEALAACDKLLGITEDPHTVSEAYNISAIVHIDMKQWDKAKTAIQKALEAEPENMEVRFTYARFFLEKGEPASAKEQYQLVLDEHPEHVRAIAGVGEILARQGHLEQGIAELEKAVQIDSTHIPARIALGNTYLLAGRPDDALAVGQQLLDEKVNSFQIHRFMGLAHADKGELEKTSESFHQMVSTAPAFAESHFLLGTILVRLGQKEQAIRELEEAVQLDPSHIGARLSLAEALIAAGSFDRALVQCQDVIQLAPDDPRGYEIAARAHRGNKDFESAADALQKAMGLRPDAVGPALTLASSYLEVRRYKEAVAAAGKALEMEPQNPTAYYIRGSGFVGTKEFDKAATDYKRAIELNPGYAQARSSLGRLYMVRKKFNEAEEQFTALLEIAPENPQVRMDLAMLYEVSGKPDKAVEQMETVLAEHPDLSTVQLGLWQLYGKLGEVDEAETLAHSILENDPESFIGHLMLGDSHMKQGNFEEAQKEFDATAQSNPGSARAHSALASAYTQQGKHREAVEECDKVLELNPGFIPAVQQAASVFWNVDPAEAEKICRDLLDARPDSIGARIALAGALLRLKRVEGAIQECERIIERWPLAVGVHTMLASIHEARKDLDSAVRHMDEAVKIAPRNATVRLKAAMLTQISGDIDRAIAEYERAVVLSPRSVVALNNLAYLYAEEKGRLDDALTVAKRAHALAQQDPAVADTLGWIHYRRGSYELAVPLLEEAVTRVPSNATLQFHLGMACLKSGRKDQGYVHLRKALEIEPNFPDAEQASEALAGSGQE